MKQREAIMEGIEVLRRLVSINTSAGNQNETEAARFLLQEAYKHGIPARVEEPVPGLGSFLATLPGEKIDSLLLLSHLDTAEVKDQAHWEEKPFSGTLKDGYVWGRGTIDCKGLTAVGWCVLLLLKDVPLKRGIVLAATAGEETRSPWGARGLRLNVPKVKDCIGVLNEGGGWEIVAGGRRWVTCQTGEKGYIKLRLRKSLDHPPLRHPTFYLSARLPATSKFWLTQVGGVPQILTRFFSSAAAQWAIASKQQSQRYSMDLRELFFHVCRMEKGDEGWELSCRVLPGAKVEEVARQATRYVGLHFPKDIEILEAMEPTESPLDHELLNAISYCHSSTILPILGPGPTDSHWFRQAGLPTYGWFPSLSIDEIMRIHQPNERMSISSFHKAVGCLYKTVIRFCT